MGRMCCCGGGSYNLLFLDRDTGLSGKIDKNQSPTYYNDLYTKRKRKWVHNEQKSLAVYLLRERINDIYVVDNGNIYVEVDFTNSLQYPTEPPAFNATFNIGNINSDAKTRWTSSDTIKDLTNYFLNNIGNPPAYSGRKVSGKLPNNNLAYISLATDLVCVDINGNEIWRIDSSNLGSPDYSIRTGNRILLSSYTQSTLGVKVYSIEGIFETDIIDNDELFTQISPVGLIDDFIYTTKSVGSIGTMFDLQKRGSSGDLISSIPISNPNQAFVHLQCYGDYIWMVLDYSIYIFDKYLNEIINFSTGPERSPTSSSVTRILPIENDGIYGVGFEGSIFKYGWDGELIWFKNYRTTDTYASLVFNLSIGLDLYSETQIVVGGTALSTNDIYIKQNPPN